MSGRSVLFAGVPATGKTTYLALLYRAIVAGRAGELQLGSYGDDRDYVNEISQRLAACEVAERTIGRDIPRVTLSLDIAGDAVALSIPDVSGELWKDTLETRQWQRDLDDQVVNATSIALFVNAGTVDTQPTIAELNAALRAFDDESSSEASAQATLTEQRAAPEPRQRKRSTQVSAVDLIQLVASRRPGPLRLALIISAWDVVAEHANPAVWVGDNLPLLGQFLETNTAWLDSTVWGVSAQGGDFEDAETKRLLLKEDLVDRSRTLDGAGAAGAIDAPLSWLLRLAER